MYSSESNLPHRADYTRAIYETLLRIEALLRDSGPRPNRMPRIYGKAALSMREAAETLGLGLSKLKELRQGASNCEMGLQKRRSRTSLTATSAGVPMIRRL